MSTSTPSIDLAAENEALRNRIARLEAELLRLTTRSIWNAHYSYDSDEAEKEARRQLRARGLLR